MDYSDSYGDLKPLIELQQYLAGNFISYNCWLTDLLIIQIRKFVNICV